MGVSYPRLQARTLRFTLGVPRSVHISSDGSTVYFVRTSSGTSRAGMLWKLDVSAGRESVVVDPRALLGDAGEELSAEERARRERSRESAAGITAYAIDDAGRWATFALSGRLWLTNLRTLDTRELPAVGAVIDPRLDPTGRHIAYASAGALRVVSVSGEGERQLVGPGRETEVWGQAEFIAAEEMNRHRGFWWSPDGTSLLVERFDEADVATIHVADPAHPDRVPDEQRYPFAGTSNADVRLWHIDLDAARTEVSWDRERFEYLCSVSWNEHGAPLIQVMTRDQRLAHVLAVEVVSGATAPVRELKDDTWVEVLAGPRYAPGGRLVTVEDTGEERRLVVDGTPISDPSLHVRGIVASDDAGVTVTASPQATEIHVVAIRWDGTHLPLTKGPGVHQAIIGGPTTLISSATLERNSPELRVLRDGHRVGELTAVAEDPGFSPGVELIRAGEHRLHTAVLFPRDHVRGSHKLPILMDPYGGPHAQRVMASARMFFEAQWLADQGFCVVVADGRGTGGRGPAWDRWVRDDLAEVTLADQVSALEAVVERYGDDVDATRVGITGWSYGGYLSALAVLRRPDLFHAAVAGAPVTEWRLYDTFYTERYLGHPDERPDVYDRNSLLPLASELSRPLMLIHGLADDNVLAAHTLRLSSALMASGRAHTVLPLSGITHMTPDEVVAENLKLLQVEFLRAHLG